MELEIWLCDIWFWVSFLVCWFRPWPRSFSCVGTCSAVVNAKSRCDVFVGFVSLRLMFPLALTAQYFGMSSSRMSMNVLARSFPWIGIHVDVLRTGQRRLWPLFRSHMLFLLIQSFVPCSNWIRGVLCVSECWQLCFSWWKHSKRDVTCVFDKLVLSCFIRFHLCRLRHTLAATWHGVSWSIENLLQKASRRISSACVPS